METAVIRIWIIMKKDRKCLLITQRSSPSAMAFEGPYSAHPGLHKSHKGNFVWRYYNYIYAYSLKQENVLLKLKWAFLELT